MEVDCTLDNVTFVGEWVDWGFVCECLEQARLDDMRAVGAAASVGAECAESLEAVRPLPARGMSGGSMRHQQAWVVDGAHLSQWVELSVLGRSWVAADLDGRCRGRIELNPNKVTARVLELMRSFRVDHLTRADAAVDYPGVALSDYVFRRRRVKTTTYARPSGVEGFLLGGRTSERYVRVYDKALELGREDLTLTRVEGVGKHRKVLDPELLDGVEALSAGVSPSLSLEDAGRVALYLYAPEVLAGHHRHTRERYRDLALSVQGRLEPCPSDVYRDRLPGLREDVERLCEGEAVRVAAVYAAGGGPDRGADDRDHGVEVAVDSESTV